MSAQALSGQGCDDLGTLTQESMGHHKPLLKKTLLGLQGPQVWKLLSLSFSLLTAVDGSRVTIMSTAGSLI